MGQFRKLWNKMQTESLLLWDHYMCLLTPGPSSPPWALGRPDFPAACSQGAKRWLPGNGGRSVGCYFQAKAGKSLVLFPHIGPVSVTKEALWSVGRVRTSAPSPHPCLENSSPRELPIRHWLFDEWETNFLLFNEWETNFSMFRGYFVSCSNLAYPVTQQNHCKHGLKHQRDWNVSV